MKKFLALILVLAMVMSVSSFAMAATTREAADATAFSTALADAVDGDTIKLTGSVSLANYVTIEKKLTIDLNGHTITSNSDTTIYVYGGELTVIDDSNTGKIINAGGFSAIDINNGGKVVMQGGNIESTADGIYVFDGTVEMTGGSITAAMTDNHMAIFIDAGSATISGGTLTAQRAVYVETGASTTIEGGTLNGADVAAFANGGEIEIKGGTLKSTDCASYALGSSAKVDISGGTFEGKVEAVDNSDTTISGGTFTEDPSAYVPANVLEATVNDGTSTKYTVGEKSTEEAAAAIPDGATDTKVTIKDKQGVGNVDLDLDPGKVDSIAIPNDAMAEKVKINGQTATVNPSGAPVPAPTAPPTAKPSSGSGISVKYNGGNSFSTSNPAVPTGVEIDGVPVTFNGTGSNFTVGCISSDAKWVTVRWNSTSVTTNFTPDGLVECTTVSIPKTGDMPIWAAVAAFFGF